MRNFFDTLEELVIEGASVAPPESRRRAEAVRDVTHVFLKQMNDQALLEPGADSTERMAALAKATAWLIALFLLVAGGRECDSVTQDKVLRLLGDDAKAILPTLYKGTQKWRRMMTT